MWRHALGGGFIGALQGRTLGVDAFAPLGGQVSG
jgi:hypothetical protein